MNVSVKNSYPIKSEWLISLQCIIGLMSSAFMDIQSGKIAADCDLLNEQIRQAKTVVVVQRASIECLKIEGVRLAKVFYYYIINLVIFR